MSKLSYFEIKIGMSFEEAKKYLKKINKWNEVKKLDGFSIVATAKYYNDKILMFDYRTDNKCPICKTMVEWDCLPLHDENDEFLYCRDMIYCPKCEIDLWIEE